MCIKGSNDSTTSDLGEKLHHTTANRVKPPQRQPHSLVGPPKEVAEAFSVSRDARRLPPTPIDNCHIGTSSGPTHPAPASHNKSNVIPHENSVDNGSDIAADLSRLRQSSVWHNSRLEHMRELFNSHLQELMDEIDQEKKIFG